MNTRQRTFFFIVAACAAVGSLSATSCDPGYNNKKPKGGTGGLGAGGIDNQGTGGVAVGGLGGETGTGGGPAGGSGGDMTAGMGGNSGASGGTNGGDMGGMNGGGMGGINGAGGGAATANLITNGDFSDGTNNWTFQITSGGAAPTHGVRAGAYCVTVGAGQATIVGWPGVAADTLALPSGASYVFSYQVTVSGGLPVDVEGKVGLFVTPYTADFDQIDLMNASNVNPARVITHTFTTAHADAQTGVGLFITGKTGNGTSDVCIDNVSLTPS